MSTPTFHFVPRDDGYTHDGYISEERGLWPALSFKYRPMLNEQRMVVEQAVQVEKPEKAAGIIANTIVAYLKEWDAQDDKGESVPVSYENVRFLWPSLQRHIYFVIMGIESSDPRPESSDDERSQDADDSLKAVLDGKMPSQVAEERNLKN